MANSFGADSQGGSFGLASDMDDLLAHGGNVGKGSKELTRLPSLIPGISQPTNYGQEATGLPDSLTSGIAHSDGDYNKGHASGFASQPPLTGYQPYADGRAEKGPVPKHTVGYEPYGTVRASSKGRLAAKPSLTIDSSSYWCTYVCLNAVNE